jgi:tRNA pseudouridine38-40 synthase
MIDGTGNDPSMDTGKDESSDSRETLAAESGLQPGAPVRRLRLTVAYDGTGYAGWQFQSGEPTVQGQIEAALREILQENPRVTGAGRTDAGVHALGQVAHFETQSPLGAEKLEKALNALLPSAIRVRGLTEAESGFHARYSALSRVYRYEIVDPGLPESVLLARTHWVRRTAAVDPGKLEECAGLLGGEHDFFTFSKTGTARLHDRCRVLRAVWQTDPGRLGFEIEADRFLRGMVRMLVGAMLAVAERRAPVEEFRQALDIPGRWLRAVPAPACGLVLVRVIYPDREPGK